MLFLGLYNVDEPYPSLSGLHDYEPQLEFDDAEIGGTQTDNWSTTASREISCSHGVSRNTTQTGRKLGILHDI